MARREAFRLLVVPQRRQALEKLVLHATSLRIPIVELEGGTLTALAGFDGHQGVALVVGPRRFASPDDILARAAERGEPPFVLALDSLEDPQNVGTLLRSAEAAGVHGVLFPTRRQAPLSPSAVKASAGAVEHLLLCPVDDLAAALADMHSRGLRIAGAEADAPLTARQSDLRGPLVIVVGSEGQGLGPTVRRRSDLLMRIPMRGAIGSLNAAVAGSILLFEALAQRDPEGATSALAPASIPVEDEIQADGSAPSPEAQAPAPAPDADPVVPTTAAKRSAPRSRATKTAAPAGTAPEPSDLEPALDAAATAPDAVLTVPDSGPAPDPKLGAPDPEPGIADLAPAKAPARKRAPSRSAPARTAGPDAIPAAKPRPRARAAAASSGDAGEDLLPGGPEPMPAGEADPGATPEVEAVIEAKPRRSRKPRA